MRVRERGKRARSPRTPHPPRFARRPPLSRGEAKIPDARKFAILPKIQTVRCSDSKDGFGLRRDESESRSASART